MKIFLLVAGILLTLGGLILLLALPVAGILFAAFGGFLIWYSIRLKKKAVQTALLDKDCARTFKVAGITKYMDAVMVFAGENEEYEYTKQQIIKEGMEDEEIPQYIFLEHPASLVYEPDNPYDSNAIAVYINELQIGYVPRDDIEDIRLLIDAGMIKSVMCEFVGGNYKIYNSDEETLETHELNIGARITVTYC